MDHQAIVEIVFKSVAAALPNELGALLGQELTCGETVCKLTTKEQLFGSDPRQKSTLAHLKVTGDNEGEAFLVLPVKTSIIFGGTLIMLPQDQIEENAKSETLDGEVADAYGEVANILAGVLTQIFLDKYPKSMRYVRTDVDELIDTKVDVASNEPFPPGNYYQLAVALEMGGENLGNLEIITPSALLGLEETIAPATEKPGAEALPEESSDTAQTNKPDSAEETPPAEVAQEKPAAPVRPPFTDAKKVADVVLKATISQVTEEVGALLGQSLTSSDLKLEMVTKGDFFSNHCTEKSVLVHMEVSGDGGGKIYLLAQSKDAILMGGTLIMLPEEEIQGLMGKGAFDGEVADAYGEVANIISGGLTQTFQERYPQPLRFVKTTAETIIPTKIAQEDDNPFPDGLYYMASCAINLQGNPLDRMFLLFPAELLGLEGQENDAVQATAPKTTGGSASATTSATTSDTTSDTTSATTQQTSPAPPVDATPVVLVIADTQEEAEAISRNLTNDNYDIKVIGYKDDIKSVFSTHPVLGVFLLMSEVGEKGFSVAIKLQSSGYTLPPVIAGGPEWTKSTVLKAVKYGARDILITPASDDEIREKASQHIALPA